MYMFRHVLDLSTGLNLSYLCPRFGPACLNTTTVYRNEGLLLSELTIPEDDTLEKLMDDMAANPEGRAAILRVLDDEAEHFLVLCVDVAKRIQLMDDVWKARRIMADWAVAMADLRGRMNKELAVQKRSTSTVEGFAR